MSDAWTLEDNEDLDDEPLPRYVVPHYASNPRWPRMVRIGADIGQRVDPTAIVVAEVEPRTTPRTPGECWDEDGDYIPARWVDHYVARHIERLPIGTSYPKVATRLAEVVGRLNDLIKDADFAGPELLVDATGVGRPVIDLLRQALRGHRCRLTAVTFTAGEGLKRGGLREIRVGKSYLVSRLQSILQTERLELPETDEARALGEELEVYEIRVNERANMVAGAFKSGTHDDLVTALELAVLLPYRSHPTYVIADPGQL